MLKCLTNSDPDQWNIRHGPQKRNNEKSVFLGLVPQSHLWWLNEFWLDSSYSNIRHFKEKNLNDVSIYFVLYTQNIYSLAILKNANSPLTVPVVNYKDDFILHLPCVHTLPCNSVCPYTLMSSSCGHPGLAGSQQTPDMWKSPGKTSRRVSNESLPLHVTEDHGCSLSGIIGSTLKQLLSCI